MSNKKKLPLNIRLLGWVSFLNDLSSEMIMPILPMFITALGGGGAAIGLIGGLRDSVAGILKILFGWFSDRSRKRKPFILAGYSSSILFKALLGLSTLWQHVLVLASLERVGKGMRTAPRDALISDSAGREKGRSFGFHRAMDTAGAILGSIGAFILFWLLGLELKLIIFIAAGVAVFSLIPLKNLEEKRGGEENKISLRFSLSGLNPRLRHFITAAGIFSLANFSYMFFVLRARDVFAVYLDFRLATALPILLYVLYNIFYASFSIPFSRLGDKKDRKKIIAGGYVLFALTCAGFAFLEGILVYIILFALYGTGYAVIDGNQRAFVSEISSEELKGTSLGSFHTVSGIAALPANLAAGFLWQASSSFSFIYGSIASLIAAAVLIFIKSKSAD